MPFPDGSSSTNEDAVVASYRDKDSRNRLKPLSYPSQEEEEKEEEEKRERAVSSSWRVPFLSREEFAR